MLLNDTEFKKGYGYGYGYGEVYGSEVRKPWHKRLFKKNPKS